MTKELADVTVSPGFLLLLTLAGLREQMHARTHTHTHTLQSSLALSVCLEAECLFTTNLICLPDFPLI